MSTQTLTDQPQQHESPARQGIFDPQKELSPEMEAGGHSANGHGAGPSGGALAKALLARYGQALAGVVISIIGIVVVLLGWYGAAHTTIVEEQIPYVISGGVLGAALIVLGGLYALIAALVRRIDRLEAMVAGQAAASGVTTAAQPAATATPVAAPVQAAPQASPAPQTSPTPTAQPSEVADAPGSDELMVAWVAGGSSYHRTGCQMVQGKAGVERGAARSAHEQGLRPCRICQPD